MRVLLVGDIVGKPGRNAFTQVAARLKGEGRVDFIIANGENGMRSGMSPANVQSNRSLEVMGFSF